MHNIVCLRCKERHIGCHSTCERYLEECRLAEEEKERIRKATVGDREMAELITAQRIKQYNYWRRKHKK